MYSIVTYVARMGEKIVYEVFNMLTGEWEESIPEKDILESFEVYLTDYETYQAEKEIITEIIRQKKASDKLFAKEPVNKERD